MVKFLNQNNWWDHEPKKENGESGLGFKHCSGGSRKMLMRYFKEVRGLIREGGRNPAAIPGRVSPLLNARSR